MMKRNKLQRVLLLLICLLFLTMTQAQEKWLYAKLDVDNLVFYGDLEPQYNDHIEGVIQFPESDDDNGRLPYWWNNAMRNVKVVRFEESCQDIIPIKSTAYMFAGFDSLKTVIGMENLNTGFVTTMKGMFQSCHFLEDFDFNSLNTQSVTNMSEMFLEYPIYPYGEALPSFDLNLSGWKTDNVTDFSDMFYDCRATGIDISGFNTEKATTMKRMFSCCSRLESLDVSHFNTQNVTDMSQMFSNIHINTLDVSHFNTQNVTDMSGMFSVNGTDPWLTSIDLSNFNTEKVTSMSSMFDGQKLLTWLDISNFSTASLTDMSFMFFECESLVKIHIFSIPDNSNGSINARSMFNHCYELRWIYVDEDWDISRLDDQEPEEEIRQWNHGMFLNCNKLIGGLGTRYENSHCNSAFAHIDGGADCPGYFCTERQMVDGINSPITTINRHKSYSLDGRPVHSAWLKRGVLIQDGRKRVRSFTVVFGKNIVY